MGESVSYRSIDQKIEREVCVFCDRHVYSGSMQIQRCHDRQKQLEGIDGYLTVPSMGIYSAPVDEKAGVHYVNRPIKTYLMELSQITNGGTEVDGWFLDPEKKTEYYMLMFLWASVEQSKGEDGSLVSKWQDIDRKNITMVEYFLVRRSDIFGYLHQCGFDTERLKKAVKYMRESGKDKVDTPYGFKFVISRSFKECPVNICIDRSVYERICLQHRYVGKFDNNIF